MSAGAIIYLVVFSIVGLLLAALGAYNFTHTDVMHLTNYEVLEVLDKNCSGTYASYVLTETGMTLVYISCEGQTCAVCTYAKIKQTEYQCYNPSYWGHTRCASDYDLAKGIKAAGGIIFAFGAIILVTCLVLFLIMWGIRIREGYQSI